MTSLLQQLGQELQMLNMRPEREKIGKTYFHENLVVTNCFSVPATRKTPPKNKPSKTARRRPGKFSGRIKNDNSQSAIRNTVEYTANPILPTLKCWTLPADSAPKAAETLNMPRMPKSLVRDPAAGIQYPSKADCGASNPRREKETAKSPCGVTTLSGDRKSTRLNSSHVKISYAVFCLKKKTKQKTKDRLIK